MRNLCTDTSEITLVCNNFLKGVQKINVISETIFIDVRGKQLSAFKINVAAHCVHEARMRIRRQIIK